MLPSNLNFEFLEENLKFYHDELLLQFLKYGFPVDHNGKTGNKLPPQNHKGATNFKAHIKIALEKEIMLCGALGPFEHSPFHKACFSPLNSVEEKETTDRRLILDLSDPTGNSINDGIPKNTYLGVPDKMELPTVDKLIERIIMLGRGCLLFKVDLRRAYRQLFICPLDFWLMGFTFEEKMYFDCTLSMGSRSSAKCCQKMTDVIVFIYCNNGNFVINYLDDFSGCDTREKVQRAYLHLRQLLIDCGLKEAAEKSCPPSTCMTFLGIEVNTVEFTMHIPKTKMAEIREILLKWEEKCVANLTEVQQLAGLLNFACKCVKSGRVYLARILNFLRSFDSKAQVKQIPQETLKDVQWWREFTPKYNGVSLILDAEWSEPDQYICTDSCLTGGGGLTTNEFFHFEFSERVKQRCTHINQLEAIVLIVALNRWAQNFKGERLVLKCDNNNTVLAFSSGVSRDEVMQTCIRQLHKIIGWFSVEIKTVHVKGDNNRISDCLSRWNQGEKYRREFKEQTALLDLKEITIEEKEFEFLF